jgi:hypothetical protein
MLPGAQASGRGGTVTAGDAVTGGADGLSAGALASADAGREGISLTWGAGVAVIDAGAEPVGDEGARLGAVLAPGPEQATSTSPIDTRDKGVRSLIGRSSSRLSAEDSGDRGGAPQCQIRRRSSSPCRCEWL